MSQANACRSDGLCASCGDAGEAKLPYCGCWVCGKDCADAHVRALLLDRIERDKALLLECDRELTATAGAVADLLCDPAWVVLHNHGWATLKARRNGVEALVAKIREALHG